MRKLILGVLFVIFMCGISYEKVYAAKKYGIQYSSHIQNIGWQNAVSNGEASGITGQALRLEAFNIKVSNNLKIRYQAHVQNIGWQNWVDGGTLSGTEGKELRVEALRIELVNPPEGVNIEYQVHVQGIGWMPWVKNGQVAGTTGKSLRIEAFRIKMTSEDNYDVSYRTHVQNIGWQEYKKDGETAGTTGKSLRVEAIQINSNSNIKLSYQTHVQNIGWQNWVNTNEVAGTTGSSLKVEAIRIKAENLESGRSLIYRTHVEGMGWQNWVSAGQISGTVGLNKRVEAIEIKVVRSEEAASLVKAKIAIDIGHNADYDNGAVGIRVEDELTREVGVKVINKLRDKGYTVIETLPSNAASTRDSLDKRTVVSNSNEVDLFASIHFNKFNGQAYGTEVYYKLDESKKYATNVLNNIVALGFYNRGIKYNDSYYVLKNTNAPAILIETCFLDSQRDMILYNAENIANKIVQGLTQ